MEVRRVVFGLEGGGKWRDRCLGLLVGGVWWGGWEPGGRARAGGAPATAGGGRRKAGGQNKRSGAVRRGGWGGEGWGTMKGELRMKSWGSVTGTMAILVLKNANTTRTASESQGQGRRS